MQTTPLFILLLFLYLFSANSVCANELSSHRAYRVTSYNLGAILELQEKETDYSANRFRPLLITNTTTDVLNNELESSASWAETNPHGSNTNGIALAAEFAATQKISLAGAFGVTRSLWTPDSLEYETESSWEANLGIIYKLINNVSYELHFGYMDTGTLFSERSSYTDVENIIMVSNRLTLSF